MPGVLHWGPLSALTIILVVTITATYSALQLWSLPTVKYFKLPNFILMYVWLFLILKNFYQALQSPGYVEYGWKPVSDCWLFHFWAVLFGLLLIIPDSI